MERAHQRSSMSVSGPTSITERLAALKRSGEEGWKSRIASPKFPHEFTSVMRKNKQNLSEASTDTHKTESVSIGNLVSERKDKLAVAQQQWQQRVALKDAQHFTVGNKAMVEQTIKSNESEYEGAKDNNLYVENQKEEVVKSPPMESILGRDITTLPTIRNMARPMTPTTLTPPATTSSSSVREVNVPLSTDVGFSFFFASALGKSGTESSDIELGDLDDLLPSTLMKSRVSKLTSLTAKRPRPPSTPSSSNPLRALSRRTDLRSSYTETVSNSSTLLSSNMSTPHSHLASEALAGLASVEDFSSVHLRHKDEEVREDDLLAYKKCSVMLLQVKGRRCCQTRLVAPVVSSVNNGDSYVLVDNRDRGEIIVWHGRLSNVIERARSAELALAIAKNKQMGLRSSETKINTVDQDKAGLKSRVNRRFFALLSLHKEASVDTEEEDRVSCDEARSVSCPDAEDEHFESAVNALTRVYEVLLDEKLEKATPIKECWGQMPKYEQLMASRPERVLIFDFGSELYVWNGRAALPELRRAGAHLVRQLHATNVKEHPLLITARKEKRPEWTLVCRVNYRMEGALFREKFNDWPADTAAKLGNLESQLAKRHDVINRSLRRERRDDPLDNEMSVEPFDGDEMHRWEEKEPNLMLEEKCLGRGKGYYDREERRQYEVQTVQVHKWMVSENGLLQEKTASGHLFDKEAFVIKWMYKVSLTARDLKGNQSRHAAVGRDRCVFFFWHGAAASKADRSVAALMTVDLDDEGHPHVHVDQGMEHAVFLNLFQGNMVVHKGKKDNFHMHSGRTKLYLIKGETESESNALEVECLSSSLRSAASFLIISQDKIYVWHGRHSRYRDNAVKMLDRVQIDDERSVAQRSVVEVEEGEESEELKTLLKMSPALEYVSSTLLSTRAPRLFHMSSLSGRFLVREVERVFLKMDNKTAMPFVQAHLYIDQQPALFMIDTGLVLWLWQGWWPPTKSDAATSSSTSSSSSSSSSSSTSSSSSSSSSSFLVRWHAERRASMLTLLDYRNAAYSLKKRPATRLAWAGHEPVELTNLFPEWQCNNEAFLANEKHFEVAEDFDTTLAKLSRNEYTWEELQQRPLPDGVDPAALERYLCRQDFRERLGVAVDEFRSLPRWKQLELKKNAALF